MMRKLIFICSGNTCRSPLALAAWRALQKEGGAPADIEADSAGLLAETGAGAASHTTHIAHSWQQDLSNHAAKSLSESAAKNADWLVVMNAAHAFALRECFSVDEHKVLLLGNFDAQIQNPEILDPFGGSREAYETCAARIRRAVAGLAKAIERGEL
jgi:protein-tyrosine phosphatase